MWRVNSSASSSRRSSIQAVLQRGQSGDQVEELKDKADLAVSNVRQLILAHPRDVDAIYFDLAVSRAVQAADDSQKRALATSRWPNDTHHFFREYLQIDPAQRMDEVAAQFKISRDVASSYYRLWHR